MDSRASVIVGKLDIECLVPATGNPQAVANRLGKIARVGLRDALSLCLEPLRRGDGQILIIKQLQLEMDVDLLLGERDIARLWADKIKTAMLKALGSRTGKGMVIFPSPAAYLSAALVDIARGRARDLWYYRQFDGLCLLPASAALRTALLGDPECGLAALALMQSGDLLHLCHTLCTADAQRLLAGLFPPLEENISREDAASFARCIAAEYGLANQLQGKLPQKAMLLAALALCGKNPPALTVVGVCARILSLLLELQQRHPQHSAEIFAALEKRQYSRLSRLLSADEIAEVAASASVAVELIRSLDKQRQVSEDLNPIGQTRAAAEKEYFQNVYTPFGNALLLLPLINALSLDAARQWPALTKQQPLALLRWLVLCTCQGADKFYAATQDPLLRDLCTVGPGLAMDNIASWLNRQLTPQQSNNLFAALQQQLPVGKYQLERVQWQCDDRLVRAQIESRKGCWISLQVESIKEAEKPRAGQKCEPARQDFETLWLPDRFQFNPLARTLLATLAQSTLKSLAWCLPGFTNCSVPYLLGNFLGMSATLEADKGRINAYVSRVPMNVILNMAGLNRGTLQLPDFDAREIRLVASP